MKYSDDGLLLLLEKMMTTYRRNLKKARKNLLLAMEADDQKEVLHWRWELRDCLKSFGYYGFEVRPIMEAFEIDLPMLGMEE